MDSKTYEYETVICEADGKGGAYVAFPYDVREEFGRGREKVHVTFDGVPYDGSVVNMGVKNADGSICYIIGIKKKSVKGLESVGGIRGNVCGGAEGICGYFVKDGKIKS